MEVLTIPTVATIPFANWLGTYQMQGFVFCALIKGVQATTRILEDLQHKLSQIFLKILKMLLELYSLTLALIQVK